jgi:hypothetical protein
MRRGCWRFVLMAVETIVLAVTFIKPICANDVPLHDKSVVRFASVTEAQSILGARDRFVVALSPFDRQSRLETDREVSEEEFLKFVQSQGAEWKPEEVAKVSKVVRRLKEKLNPFRLSFPAMVLLVQTTGREEGDAAYCRGNAVILPHDKIAESDDELERLLTHEFFHILSSHNPDWRYELYKIIGFQKCSPVELPASLKHRKITNPDAPVLDAYITLDVDGENVFAVPVLYSKSERFDVKLGGPFFRYLTFRLMVVDQVAGKWQAVLDSGEPRMLQPNQIADYKRKIGGNTQYIIHPDEIMADNFVHLIQQTQSVPSPQIIDALRQTLSK